MDIERILFTTCVCVFYIVSNGKSKVKHRKTL